MVIRLGWVRLNELCLASHIFGFLARPEYMRPDRERLGKISMFAKAVCRAGQCYVNTDLG